MSEQAEAITKFRDVTDVDEEQAKAYLEAANNNLQVALHHYFGEHGMEEVVNLDSDEVEEPQPVKGSQDKPTSDDAKSKSSNSRFHTVSGLNLDSSSDEEEGGQAFYAGGSTHSGQQVLGPARPRNQIVDEMFRSVKEHGGEVVNQEVGSSKPNTLKFSGTGYRLGETSNDTQGRETSRGRQEVTITLQMWRQGFSINDGPLRKYNEPQNMLFLKTVSRGVIPEELLRQAQGNEVHLNMEDHSHEDYTLVKPKLKAFSGKGNVLGNPVPGTTPATAPPPALAPSTDERAACEARAREAIAVDSAQPTTSVQIRLVDGSRLVGTFNHTHTVSDLRSFIATARPEFAGTNFHLLTTFPSKDLADETATLASAGILNAALLQRLG